MSTLLAIALAAAATQTQPDCSWDRPGANPYTGTPEAAIDRYTDIPEATRTKLKRRMAYGNPDEMVDITRDAITGKYAYAPTIRDMHFGPAQMCHSVTRSKWQADRVEPGAVYCADSHCILVPNICGNVSRITRLTPGVAAAKPVTQDIAAEDWSEHVGTYELGLIDAPAEEDLDEGRKALREGLAALLPQAPEAAAPADGISDKDAAARERERALARLAAAPRPETEVLEDAPVAAVPEAESWAMMLGGLGLVGWLARRRQRRAQARHASKNLESRA